MRFRADGRTLFALVVLAFGLFFAVQIPMMAVNPAYARVGPTVVPMIVAAGLTLSGAMLLAEAVTREAAWIDDGRLDLVAFGWILGALAAYIASIAVIGFVLASVILFVATARAFGSRRWWLDAPVGAVLALLVFTAFTRGLGMSLPAGPLSLVGLAP
jgi:putative tricarboxylic transport membrane protein